MARTPLLSAFQSLFRDLHAARANGVSLEALQDIRAEHAERVERHALSRREFLVRVGGAAAAAAVPRFSFGAAQPTVVIVGAGIAGLNCALELSDLGIHSTV